MLSHDNMWILVIFSEIWKKRNEPKSSAALLAAREKPHLAGGSHGFEEA